MAQSEAQNRRERIIDENLKRVYEEAVEEGVPDRFQVLLDALRQEEQKRAKSK